ncbi:hypothetical protein JTB14_006427 [Gonioctena quinquepunctata]|nr:hypothetical protein JTB14_006427 [Gonioctena quinquepunctata]
MPLQRSGDGASSWKSSWPYFESLCFLKEHLDNSSSVDKPPLANSSSQNKGSNLNLSTSTAKKCKQKQTDSDVGTALIRLEEEKLQILEKHP